MREIQMSSLIHEKRYHQLLGDITGLCENARSVLVEAYWQVGKRIVEEEQAGNVNADHGTQLIERLAEDLTANFGSGFSKANVYNFGSPTESMGKKAEFFCFIASRCLKFQSMQPSHLRLARVTPVVPWWHAP